MTATTHSQLAEPVYFDFAFLRKVLLWFAAAVLVFSPFASDPLVLAACGFVPWILVVIVDRPGMPSVIVFYLLFVWLQAAARVLRAFLDGESLADGFYGSDVYRAFWYSMASLVVFALSFRMTLRSPLPVSREQLAEHLEWRPLSLFYLYIATLVVAFALAPLTALSSGIGQAVGFVAFLKYVALFMLFSSVLATGNGNGFLLAAMLLEIASGFTGLFSGFKMVFIVLLLAALSLRLPLRLFNIVAGAAAVVTVATMGLFWTAVKADYRSMASGYSNEQHIAASLGERAGFLLRKAFHPEEIDWADAANNLLNRIAYIDFFGASITVVETAPEDEFLARWRDALEHVAKPRILFPDKAALNDTEVFVRYVRIDSADSRLGTSISIGFLTENFIDFGFPAMLVPIAALSVMLGLMLRYFMTRRIAWVTREGCCVALVLALAAGMEVSLAKFVGGSIMLFVVLFLNLKFVYPMVARWLRN